MGRRSRPTPPSTRRWGTGGGGGGGAEAREKAAAEGKDPEAARPADKAQRNFTDPESRIQKTSDGFIQGYNAQIAVDEHRQIIVSQHVTSAAPDVQELEPPGDYSQRVLRSTPKARAGD